jgi:hypothetical protein
MNEIVQYYVIGGLMLANIMLSAVAFGYFGWKSSRAGLPISTLASYTLMFAFAGLGGVAAQLMFG